MSYEAQRPYASTGSKGASGAAANARRIAKRRPIYFAQAGSYLVDAAILCCYAALGDIDVSVPLLFLVSGIGSTAIWLMLSEIGFNDRFKDHYLTVPQSIISMTIPLLAIYFAPGVGFYFIFVIFIILGFGALRLNAWQTGLVWTYATVSLTALFLTVNLDIAIPMSSWSERALAVTCIVTVLARCASAGLYGSSLREALYRKNHELDEARAKIEELAYLDELTGASNRRDILKTLDEQIARVTRDNGSCAVALLDLDHFKRINDLFGHSAGDDVLRTFSITAYANIRDIDRFGRYGGEEFLLILPDTEHSDAVRLVDRLRLIFSESDWSAISPELEVTLSAGFSTIRQNDTVESVLLRADMALYKAKAQGRNRVVIA